MKFKTPEQYKRSLRICPIIFHQVFKRDLVLGMDGFDEKYEIHAPLFNVKDFLSSKSLSVDSVIAKYSTNGFSSISLKNIFKSFREQININKNAMVIF